ncbi:MAG TPA: hypothetical protein VFV99_14070 [Kofleriaceae bacterium]|nr:hypothetical protein [Kofleriaceae bacterium]
MRKLIPLIISAALGSCYTSGSVEYASSGVVDLAYVAPGVSVIANYGEPIFYSDGAYWYNAYGGWYRSPYYTGGWKYVQYPPYRISQIRAPLAYRYYRPYGYVPRYRPVPANRIRTPHIYDYRSARRNYNYQPGHNPYYRDHAKY